MARAPKVTLSDVAAAAKVSMATASMVLANAHPGISPQTRRRVFAMSRRLNYRQGAARREVKMPPVAIRRLGCVCLGETFDRPNIGMWLSSVTAGASRRKVRLDAACIEDISNDQKVADELAHLAEPLDGLLLIGTVRAGAIASILKAHIPCVAIGDQPAEESGGLDVVTFDHVRAGKLATAHLLRRGHRHIAFLSDTLRQGGANPHWLEGYRLAHIDANVPADPQLVFVTNIIDGGTVAAVETLIRLDPPPTAWVVINNYQAAELLITLQRLGRKDEVVGLYVDKPPQVEGFGAILYSVKAFCEAALSRLVYLCNNPGEPALRTIVPFETINIDS